jgi:hypothetical protein
MTDTPLDDIIEDLRGHIERDVAAGFRSADEIIESVVEVMDGEAEPAMLRAAAERLTQAAMTAHLTAQATWPPVTDCDRLDASFAELDRRGIVARQDFSCCGTCGAGEIRTEMEDVAAMGRPVRGYAFYHMQDTEAAAEGQGLYLAYGSADEGELPALGIAGEIVDVLRTQGLAVTWDGTWNKRIQVSLDWKRRRRTEQ